MCIPGRLVLPKRETITLRTLLKRTLEMGMVHTVMKVESGSVWAIAQRSKRQEDMCFGPRGCFGEWFGRAAGIVFGLLIVAFGLIMLAGSYLGMETGPLFIIVIGIVVIVGSYLAYTRKF